MASVNSGIKGPTRPAPRIPMKTTLIKTEMNDWPQDPFSPPRLKQEKKKPPPRPPPPRINSNQGSNHFRSIFGSSKRNGKKGKAVTAIVKPLPAVPPPVIPTGTLIDLQTPPASPKSQRYISSVWSLSSSSSPCESGFEDDFSSIISSGTTTPSVDLLSPDVPPPSAPPLLKAPLVQSKPTIICVPKSKPSRPPPPQLGGSPPMPSVPPPPPPPHLLQVLTQGPPLPPRPVSPYTPEDPVPPTCTALYDYESTHPDDLQFKTGETILLLGEEGKEWLRGRLRGQEGMFPRNYVKVNEDSNLKKPLMTAIALFSFNPASWDDLELQEGDTVKVLDRVNSYWLYGECAGKRGIFPEAYVQDISSLDD